MGGYLDGCVDGCIDGSIFIWIGGWMNGWTYVFMDGLIYRRICAWKCGSVGG
jgi:hypothetical protein